MPTNNQTDDCISTEGEALVFWSPGQQPRRHSSRVQIIDVFCLKVATGYSRDPQGRLLLEAQTSVAAGRSWSLAKAAQLIRNDARPHRWVALQMDKRAWGLFWAGGGLQRCRELLAGRFSDAKSSSAIVPATPEVLLRLMLDLEPQQHGDSGQSLWPEPAPVPAERPPVAAVGPNPQQHGDSGQSLWPEPAPVPAWRPPVAAVGPNPWQLVAWASLAWLIVLGITVAGFLAVLERQDRKLELLLQRTAPAESIRP
ncbi:hypothetical protein VB734_08335 [Synechococcus sp. BA-124 BA4]|nr:hypothetical protein [Synechococcus sp. BA-124 BA4]CAK6701019.1 hypothetical protein BBFGKLBO_02998 [Synechococcus sp. CBW1107]